jgi:putative addiction module killer protein
MRQLGDPRASVRIHARIKRLGLGNPGDVAPVGQGESELRIDFGAGYRVCFIQHGIGLVILLAAGTKQRQRQDIRLAHRPAQDLRGLMYGEDKNNAG